MSKGSLVQKRRYFLSVQLTRKLKKMNEAKAEKIKIR